MNSYNSSYNKGSYNNSYNSAPELVAYSTDSERATFGFYLGGDSFAPLGT